MQRIEHESRGILALVAALVAALLVGALGSLIATAARIDVVMHWPTGAPSTAPTPAPTAPPVLFRGDGYTARIGTCDPARPWPGQAQWCSTDGARVIVSP